MIWRIFDIGKPMDPTTDRGRRFGIVDLDGFTVMPPELFEGDARHIVRLHNKDVLVEHRDADAEGEYCWRTRSDANKEKLAIAGPSSAEPNSALGTSEGEACDDADCWCKPTQAETDAERLQHIKESK